MADDLSHHHQAGGNADAHLQPGFIGDLQFADGLDNIKPGAHRPLGVVFMGLRITEIN